jgi:glycosyltransferase involved in cell wall biosynthesis
MEHSEIVPIQLLRRGPLRKNTGGPVRVAADLLDSYAKSQRYTSYGFISVNDCSIVHEGRELLKHQRKDNAAKRAAGVALNTSNFGLLMQLERDKFRLRTRLNDIPKHGSVIHSHDQIASGLIAPYDIPQVLTLHSKGSVLNDVKLKVHPQIRGSFMERRFRNLERRAIEDANVITFPSIGAREIIESDLAGALEDKDVRIVYNGIDLDSPDFKDREEAHEAVFTIVSVCALVEEKRFDRVIGITEALKQQGINFRIIHIGDGPLKETLQREVEDKRVADCVQFKGKLDRADVLAQLRVADAFLLTGERVVFDLATLEAMACSLPVVLSDSGGNKEMISDSVEGYLCPEDDIESYCARIQSLYQNREAATAMGRAARERIERQFSLSRMVENFHAIYAEILKPVE